MSTDTTADSAAESAAAAAVTPIPAGAPNGPGAGAGGGPGAVENAPMTSPQRWLLALTSMAAFMIALDSTIVTTALTTIRRSLGASVESLEWTINAYTFTFAVLLLTGSALGDRFGRRRLFVIGLLIFTASSAMCSLSQTIGELIAARAVQGVGAAIVLPLAISQLNAGFPPRQLGRVNGMSAGIVGLATFSGPFIGGLVAQGLAWQWLFWVNVPVGMLVVLGVLMQVPETRGPAARLDLVGVVLASGGALGLVWALVRGNSVGWTAGETLGSFTAGALLTVAFVRWEMRVAAPMVPMRFFRNRTFSAANTSSFLLVSTLYGTLFFLAQYFQTVLHYGPFAAGARMMPWTGTLMVCAPIAGRLSDRLGVRRFVIGGMVLQAIGLTWISLVTGPGTSYLSMLPALLVSGCGLSMTIPTVQKAAVATVRPQEIGKASGVYAMIRQFGGLFGTAVSVAVFSAAGSVASTARFTDGFSTTMRVLAGFALLGAVIGLLLPRIGASASARDAVTAPRG